MRHLLARGHLWHLWHLWLIGVALTGLLNLEAVSWVP